MKFQVVLREHVRAHHSGPDPKCHGSMTPYLCKVCGDSYGTSEEIVAHIVQHCDDNTALRRQPQTGPRKYKRRRKLKPFETNVIPPRMAVTYEPPEPVSDSDDNTKRKLGKKNKQQHRSNVEEGYQNVLKSFESSLQNISSIVSNSKANPAKSKLSKKKLKKEEKKNETQTSAGPGRPKMIHTQKTRVPVQVGGDGVKKGQKTKTMVTRTPKVMPNEHKSGIFPGGERNRPRTKNVSYHIEGKLQLAPATFPKPNDEPEKTHVKFSDNIKLEPELQKGGSAIHSNNNGNIAIAENKVEPTPRKKPVAIKRSKKQKQVSIKQEMRDDEFSQDNAQNNNNAMETNETTHAMDNAIDGNNLEVAYEASIVTEEEESILPDLGTRNIHTEVITKENFQLSVKMLESSPHRMLAVHHVITPVDEVPETIIPDAVEYTCEMCAAVFSSRAELLVHVPIHI